MNIMIRRTRSKTDQKRIKNIEPMVRIHWAAEKDLDNKLNTIVRQNFTFRYNSVACSYGDAKIKSTSQLTFSRLEPDMDVHVVIEGFVYKTKTILVKINKNVEYICIPWFERQKDDNRSLSGASYRVSGAPVLNQNDELVGILKDWNTEYSFVTK